MGKKSDLDFLEEFEKELGLEGNDYEDFLNDYEGDFFDLEDDMESFVKKETPKETDTQEIQEIVETMDEPKETPFVSSPNPMDIDALIGGASEIMGASEKPKAFSEEPISFPEQSEEASAMEAFGGFSFDDMNFDEEIPLAEAQPEGIAISEEDAFADFFKQEEELPVSMEDIPAPPPPGSEVIDLSNLAEEDLMSLLAGEDAFSDLGDMLSQSEKGEPIEEIDAFAAFAENEMSMPNAEGDGETASGDKKKEKKKGGFLEKLKLILFGDDDDDEDEIVLGKKGGKNASQLSDENAEILASMEEEEKGGKKKKEKKKKEKKKKEAKPKKEKAPKPPKEKKPKKEKPPKEVDNTPPLPKKPVILIWLMVISLFVLVYIGPGLLSYTSAISTAKSLSDNGEYAEAYSKLFGMTIKEKDMELYNQIASLAPADSEIKAYEVFLKNNWQLEALDSLICAAGRCELNEENADLYACAGKMEVLKSEVTNKLREQYGMTYEEALELYHAKNRDLYTIALNKKLKELGLE